MLPDFFCLVVMETIINVMSGGENNKKLEF